MKLVIDIPEDLYEYCILKKDINDIQLEHNNAFYGKSLFEIRFMNCIINGTPLPKGHGRLIDADVLCDYFWDNRSRLYPHKDLRIVIDRQPTIIEADKENEEHEEIDDWRDRLDELEREEYYESKYRKEQE